MTANDLNPQTIIFSGQSYKSLPFTGINRIDAYSHESNSKVAWNSDRYLGEAYSIDGSTIVSFSFSVNNALSNSDFFALLIIQSLTSQSLIQILKSIYTKSI